MQNLGKTTTNSSRGVQALSLRLKTLSSYYRSESYVWDIGCDHGHLGMSFRNLPSVQSIFLVDPALAVIEKLKNNINDSYITDGKINIIHSAGQDLKINHHSNCIFIAGMGGKEIGEIISHLLPQLDSSDQIVISPHRKILELRRLLNTLPLGLIKEEVIWENEQFYLILALRPGEDRKVSLYGDELWETPVGAQYREHQLKHFSLHADSNSRSYMDFLTQSKSLKSSL